ncbi:Uncharacterized protein OS=Pirellula staleyi (strain ATCC 27377 / DSM 6068 / ICPB 4128) GN=Psta_1985 PE=4 SV=1 [Gemmata massiliana]|uniref:Carboxypeptidase regulatory-like domain-containing protein n=1 Tax=Gemmata massiliana TaxID=1210884 RepID=A0A6P2CXC9_9BACT|nr:hypothetical protein [Gemmata massiliana]VTR91762.1 Uncharacterized protein OS=Pirellula staleyi (strain ATCC 27377 / DSM 6068 / ICPB 4128) GN=Psta_1985 PE=4 SV=1 [Gemmata massiliana]
MSNRNRMWTRALFAAAVLTSAFLAGCGGTPKAEVTGTVTLDGVPVENGIIQFYPAGGAGQSVGGGIEKGKYKVEASVGEMTVTINASKVVGKHKMFDTKESPEVDTLQELVPDEYNKTSTLKVTFKEGVNENVNFELKSTKKKK